MKAMRFDEYGPPEVLHLVEVDQPRPGPGQIRIRVRAAGVNPVDWKIRGGTSRRAIPIQLPSIPGLEAAGIVDELGPDVAGVSVGDEVFGAAISGAAAEHTVLDHWARKPASMSWAEAGGLSMAVETAARGLDLLGDLSGRTIVISGAAGGVGTATVQLAAARGATVIATAGMDNQAYLRSLGAAATTYGPGLADRVRPLAPRGVDAAIDVAGHGVLDQLIEITGSPDRVITFIDPDAASLGVRFTTGSEGRAFYALTIVADLSEAGAFHMPVAAQYPLTELGDAHRMSETGHVRGKIVITVP